MFVLICVILYISSLKCFFCKYCVDCVNVSYIIVTLTVINPLANATLAGGVLWIWAYSVGFMNGPMFYGISAFSSVLNTFWFAHSARYTKNWLPRAGHTTDTAGAAHRCAGRPPGMSTLCTGVLACSPGVRRCTEGR